MPVNPWSACINFRNFLHSNLLCMYVFFKSSLCIFNKILSHFSPLIEYKLPTIWTKEGKTKIIWCLVHSNFQKWFWSPPSSQNQKINIGMSNPNWSIHHKKIHKKEAYKSEICNIKTQSLPTLGNKLNIQIKLLQIEDSLLEISAWWFQTIIREPFLR